jgi:hypothetical protein
LLAHQAGKASTLVRDLGHATFLQKKSILVNKEMSVNYNSEESVSIGQETSLRARFPVFNTLKMCIDPTPGHVVYKTYPNSSLPQKR